MNTYAVIFNDHSVLEVEADFYYPDSDNRSARFLVKSGAGVNLTTEEVAFVCNINSVQKVKTDV